MSICVMTHQPNGLPIAFGEVREGDLLASPSGRRWIVGHANHADYDAGDGVHIWHDTNGDRFIQDDDEIYLVYRKEL